ncbi:B3/4 domain-containing protein [Klebsiella pneumoniae]|uniref:B3/4 domain-containing protein n=1 Tax=Klebsiella pneumoniae TaxID=573 RepID=A0A447RS54_KLEPN|nr:B3/4 domain-containing protein [Klebsiella pneumoniae]
MWFILESLPAMPLSALHEAGERLVGYLQQLMPGARASITLLRADDEGDPTLSGDDQRSLFNWNRICV